MTIDYEFLSNAVSEGAAFRRIARLQPVGGQGDKIFPPTYPGARNNDPARHVFERRKIGGKEVWAVLVDSVQSQANRLEEGLLALNDGKSKGIAIPYVVVTFAGTGLEPLNRITSLDAPHRVYDAIFRDSLLNDEPFMQSDYGRRLAAANSADATALLELSPTTLVFGAWHSQGEGGGFGAKFPRTLVSEIMAVDTPVDETIVDSRTGELAARTSGRRTGSRIDPLGILRKVEVFKGDSGWSNEESAAGKRAKKVRPSEINHGNIAPSVEPLGITCDHIEHRTTITLAGIRRLRFGGGDKDNAGRALIASLGLLAVAEQDVRGYALRSRCDLVCDGIAQLELVNRDGSTSPFEFDHPTARSLYASSYQQALSAGFKFVSLLLKPQPKLIEIVRESRKLALEGKGSEDKTQE